MTKTRVSKDGIIDGGWTIADQSINEQFDCDSAYKTEAEAKVSKSKLVAPYALTAEIRLINVRYSHVDGKGKVSHSIGQRWAILFPRE